MTDFTLKRRKWEEVCNVEELQKSLWTEDNTELSDGVIFYYQTYGGGPEGGYFVKVVQDSSEDGYAFSCGGVWKAHRNWFQHWELKKIPNATLEYQDERPMEGKVARCRVVIRSPKKN
jgi:hypothetical protein